jgi:hypothetical protein
MNSVKKTARLTGLFYLAIFFANIFVFIFVSGSLNVAGDATATAENIQVQRLSLLFMFNKNASRTTVRCEGFSSHSLLAFECQSKVLP